MMTSSFSGSVARAVSEKRAADRAGKYDDGSFEKCAVASAAYLLPLLGAGVGAGVGAYSDSKRPADEDEDRKKRRLSSLLFGTGAGALGGAGVFALANLMDQSAFKEDKSTWLGRLASHLDPNIETGVGMTLVGNALWPSRGRLHKVLPFLKSKEFGSTNTSRGGRNPFMSPVGTDRGRMNLWDRFFGNGALDLGFDDRAMYKDVNRRDVITNLINKVFDADKAHRGPGMDATQIGARAQLFSEVFRSLSATQQDDFLNRFKNMLRTGTRLAGETDAQFRQRIFVDMFQRAKGENLHANMRYNQNMFKHDPTGKGGGRVLRTIRSGGVRALSGLVGLPVLIDGLSQAFHNDGKKTPGKRSTW